MLETAQLILHLIRPKCQNGVPFLIFHLERLNNFVVGQLAATGEVYTWGWKECVPSVKIIHVSAAAESFQKDNNEKQNALPTEQGNPPFGPLHFLANKRFTPFMFTLHNYFYDG